MDVVAEATGYPSEFLELNADMEGELGIDSIKQAEIMAELRARYGLPVDDSFQLREYPTQDMLLDIFPHLVDEFTHVVESKLEDSESEQLSSVDSVVDSTKVEEKIISNF